MGHRHGDRTVPVAGRSGAGRIHAGLTRRFMEALRGTNADHSKSRVVFPHNARACSEPEMFSRFVVPFVAGRSVCASFIPVGQVVRLVVLEELGVVGEWGVVDAHRQIEAAVVGAGGARHLLVAGAHHRRAGAADGGHVGVAHVALAGSGARTRGVEQVRLAEARAGAHRCLGGDADHGAGVDRWSRAILGRQRVGGRAAIGGRQAGVDGVGPATAVVGRRVRGRNVSARHERERAQKARKAIENVHRTLRCRGVVKVFTPTFSVNGSYTLSKDRSFCQ